MRRPAGRRPISAEDMGNNWWAATPAEIDAAEDDAPFDLKGLCSDNLDYLEQDPVSLNPSHGIHSLEGNAIRRQPEEPGSE